MPDRPGKVRGGGRAYPIYSSDYRDALGTVRDFIEGIENLQTIGRNGLHRYNNQDHAMLTGMLAARNLVLGERNELWSVNVDEEYHEEVRARGLSEQIERAAAQGTSTQVFNKLDRVALGAAIGSVSGVGLCVVTAAVAVGGTPQLADFLGLVGQYRMDLRCGGGTARRRGLRAGYGRALPPPYQRSTRARFAVGDARQMSEFADASFDVVLFSLGPR